MNPGDLKKSMMIRKAKQKPNWLLLPLCTLQLFPANAPDTPVDYDEFFKRQGKPAARQERGRLPWHLCTQAEAGGRERKRFNNAPRARPRACGHRCVLYYTHLPAFQPHVPGVRFVGSHSNKGMQMELKIGKKAATAPRHATARAGWWTVDQATATATIAAPATPAHWACELDAKRGVSRHLWEQHGSAGKRAPAATSTRSSEYHAKGTCTCSAQRTAHSTRARARTQCGLRCNVCT
jgi:hypothetical protein